MQESFNPQGGTTEVPLGLYDSTEAISFISEIMLSFSTDVQMYFPYSAEAKQEL